MGIHAVSAHSIEQAVARLREGDLVAFPTETVYGLGADALNPDALARLYQVKGRPSRHPVIVHLATAESIEQWATDIPIAAWKLAKHIWPGPLTLILSRLSHVPDAVTGGQETVGLRVPGHPVAQALLTAFDGGIAAPSANRFGRLSPTSAGHVQAELGALGPMILDGGVCPVGVESTIVAFEQEIPVILRPGMITAERIEAVVGRCRAQATVPLSGQASSAIRAPGTLSSHYAPQTPLTLVPAEALDAWVRQGVQAGRRIGVLWPEVLGQPVWADHSQVRWVPMPAHAEAYAHQLYHALWTLDGYGLDALVTAMVPESGAWWAVADRLQRASYRS